MAINTIFNLWSRPWLLAGLLWSVLSWAETQPRLGTLMDIEPEVLIVVFDDAPEQEPQRIPITGRARDIIWQPGMAVRVWPADSARATARVSPIGLGGSGLDRTGVRRRLSRGGRLGGRGTASGGGGHGGR